MENELEINESENILKNMMKDIDLRYCYWDNIYNIPVFCMFSNNFPIGEVKLYKGRK